MLLAVCVVLCVAMDRLVPLCIVIAIVSLCRAYPQNIGTAVAKDGQVGIGLIAGGKFGPGSFSVGRPGSSIQGGVPLENNEDESDGEHIVVSQTENDGGQRENNRPPQHANSGEGNTVNAAKPRGPQLTPGQGGQGGSGGGQIIIGTIVVPSNKKNKGNKRRNGSNKKPVSGADALDAIFDSNSGGNKGSSIVIDEISGGSFQPGTFAIKDKRPTGAVPDNLNAPNKENTVNTANNEALHTIGHGTNSNQGIKAEDGNVGPINPGKDYISGSNDGEEPWVWS